jgi:hypothetical protein
MGATGTVDELRRREAGRLLRVVVLDAGPSSRVVELLLATMKPWQLLAGKILGLGLLGLAQIVLIAVVGVGGALAFDPDDIPGELVGTAVSVVAWFVLGYAFYAAIFAVAASLISRQWRMKVREALEAERT